MSTLSDETRSAMCRWLFGNLGVASGLHIISIRQPEDKCKRAAGWGGIKDHVSFNSNAKGGMQLDSGVFVLALRKALQLRESHKLGPSFTMIPEDCDGGMVTAR